MEAKLIISPSPHINTEMSTSKIMNLVTISLLPALATSIYFSGINALIITAFSIISCILVEYLLEKFVLKKDIISISDGSAMLTGILIAFNLPSQISLVLVFIGCFMAIALAKTTYGGLGQNIFNPALVGRAFLLISFPAQMTTWPKINPGKFLTFDSVTSATPLGIIKEGLMAGKNVPDLLTEVPSNLNLFFGIHGGSFGEVSILALLVGGLFLIYKGIIKWHIPISFIGTVFLVSLIANIINPDKYAPALFHILSGGLILGAFYMATDLVTSPMSPRGKLIFGIGCGLITIAIRFFGAYPEGVSFGILVMNAFVPLIDRYFKPKLFGVT